MNNKKASMGGSTVTPLYETIAPDGSKVTFTPTDLVIGNGYLRSKSGKQFKLTKFKGSSLSDKVMSQDFGKVKK